MSPGDTDAPDLRLAARRPHGPSEDPRSLPRIRRYARDSDESPRLRGCGGNLFRSRRR